MSVKRTVDRPGWLTETFFHSTRPHFQFLYHFYSYIIIIFFIYLLTIKTNVILIIISFFAFKVNPLFSVSASRLLFFPGRGLSDLFDVETGFSICYWPVPTSEQVVLVNTPGICYIRMQEGVTINGRRLAPTKGGGSYGYI